MSHILRFWSEWFRAEESHCGIEDSSDLCIVTSLTYSLLGTQPCCQSAKPNLIRLLHKGMVYIMVGYKANNLQSRRIGGWAVTWLTFLPTMGSSHRILFPANSKKISHAEAGGTVDQTPGIILRIMN